VHTLPAIRLTASLNAIAGQPSPSDERWLRGIVGSDVAHHVVDPGDVLGLGGLHAVELAEALPRLASRESLWVLALPAPGQLSGLRGPQQLNVAALDQGAAVIASTAAIALVPYRVGPAIQWRTFSAERPALPADPYDAERDLSESVLRAAGTLARLDVAGGTRPAEPELQLPAGYPNRQRFAADRAIRLLVACETALADDGASISSYEADARSRELRAVRDTARTALCAAVTWCRAPDGAPELSRGPIRWR
jgi:hypothetical protein